MRICRISAAFVPPWSGLGPGPYELSRAQSESGHRLTVITRHAEGSEELDRDAGFAIHRIRTRRSLSFSFRAALTFFRLHRREPFDLVHNHGESAIALLMLGKLLALKTPIISSVHVVRRSQYRQYKWLLEREEQRGELDAAVLKTVEKSMALGWMRKTLFYEKRYLRLSDALATVSDSLRRDIEDEYGITGNLFTVGNGVAASGPAPDGCRELKDRLGCGELILFVGRLFGGKGEFELLEAMVRIRASRPGVKLLIVGQGPVRPALASRAEDLGLGDAVAFAGQMPRDELHRCYSAADIFILPSWSEGLPKVLLEAMAAGTAAVVSDIPAHRDLVTHGRTGYLFPTGDPLKMAETVLAALDDDGRAEVTGRAAALIREHYTWPAVARRLDDVYNAVLTANQPHDS